MIREKGLRPLFFCMLSLVIGIILGFIVISAKYYTTSFFIHIAIASILALLFICYSLTEVDEGLRAINTTLRHAFGLDEESTGGSPGLIFYKCRHAKVERYEENEACRIYVNCRRGLMLAERGCVRGCFGYEEPPKPVSGIGLFGGAVGGGALGLVGGPIGVVVGAVLGGLIGHHMEETSLSPQMSELERRMVQCREKRKRVVLHIFR